MLKIIILVCATVSVFVCILGLIKGKKYENMVENLDSSEYFLKDFYVIGFFLNSTKLFKLRGKIETSLISNAKLVWNNIYYQYYANLAWAQFLSLSFLVLSIGLIICSFLGNILSLFVLVLSVVLILFVWNFSVLKIKDAVKERRIACESEFPNMVSKLSLLINSGMVLREAWYFIAESKKGPLYDLMKETCEFMNNGESDQSAINKFGILSDSREIKKFTSSLIQSLEKGNSDLVDFMLSQVTEQLEHKRQIMLQKGEVAAGKLIVPIGIMFAGVIMIIMAAALQNMSF